jgi:hypothetical protein
MTAVSTSLPADVHGYGALGSRPAAGVAGREYVDSSTKSVYRDNGTSWDDISPPGTSGFANPMTTKGDLIVGDTGGSPIRKAIGTDGFVLTADAASTGGMKWAAAGGSSAEDPISDAFGAPTTAFEFASNSLTGLTTFGSPDVLDAHTSVPNNLYVKDKNASFQWCGVYATASAAPGTVITKVTGGALRNDFHYLGVFLGVATPGAMALAVTRRNNSGGANGPAYWYGVTATAGDTGGTIAGVINIQFVEPAYYLAVVATSSTSFAFYYSSNGRTWVLLGSGLNPSLTIGSFGVGINAGQDNTTGLAAAFEFVRYWDTAKTIPAA